MQREVQRVRNTLDYVEGYIEREAPVTEQRSVVEELEELVDELVRELDGIAVRRNVIATLDPKDQRIVVGMLQPFLDLPPAAPASRSTASSRSSSTRS